MKHAISSFALSLVLALPVLAACSGSTADDPAPADDGSDPTGSVDSEVKLGKKKSCAAVGGACVGLSPSSCTGGVFADAAQVSCGGGIGVACCIACPAISAPAPGFCTGGTIVPRKNANGCNAGFDCVMPPPAPECPQIMPPAPGFCTNGIVVPRKNSNGCTTGFDCAPNACVAAGGTCLGLAMSTCLTGHWADATTHSCGGGIGVGCCLP
jgi:hypothetical protein